MRNKGPKPHIHLTKNKLYERVVACGAPERAEKISTFLDRPKALVKHREYHSYLGYHKDTPILVCSHGVGSAGAAICFQELIDVGAKTIIRLGTAGALQKNMKIGDVIIASSAVRKDGVTPQMVPIAYPAIADLEITSRLIDKFARAHLRFISGTVVSSDLFYPGLMDHELEMYSKAGAKAAEMECSALFIIGALRKVRTGAVLIADGNPLEWNKGNYNPRARSLLQSLETAIPICLDVLSELRK